MPRSPKRHTVHNSCRARTGAALGHSFSLEALEARALMYAWTPQEVYLSELINRARADPTAESTRLNLNFTQGLTFGEQALLVGKEPLALNAFLTAAARAQSADMGARNFFDHTNPDGLGPTARAQNAGYLGTAGENIGAGYTTIDDLYRSWMGSPDERRNVLSLYTNFDPSYHYTQVGPGFAFGVTGAAYPNYFTADFGNPSSSARTPWLMGVVYADADHNQFYSIGEGLAGVRVDVFTGSTITGTPAATYTTDAAGNYQLPLTNGAYTLVFTRTSDNYRAIKTATITGQNVEASAKASDFTPPDDHPNSGQWSSADPIITNSTTGNGASSGVLEVAADNDLFTFVAGKTGVTHIVGSPTGGGFTGRIRVYNAAFSLIATGAPGSPGTTSVMDIALTSGSTYYILVDANNTPGTGGYSVTIQGPPDEPPPPSIPPQYLGADGEPVNPTFLGGKPVLAFVNQLGQPIVAMRNALGLWVGADIQAATGSPAVSGDISLWVDSRDGFLYAAARSIAGVLVFKRDNSNHWTFRNLTAEILVSRPIVSNLTTFTDSAGLRQIAGLDANGQLITYWMTGIMWPAGWRYFFTDVNARDLARRNHPMPAVTDELTSYVTQKNSLNVVAMTSDGSVILFYRPGGGLATQLWNWANLTNLTHVAPIVGNLTATETSGRIVNISGVDASGNLWMITWRSGEGWTSHNASAASGGVALAPTSVTSWINTAGAGFVAGLTTGGEIVLYRYTFTGGASHWTFATLSASVPNAPLLTGPLRSTILATGAIIITGLTDTGEVIRYTFTPGGVGTWAAESVSDLLAP